MSTENDAQTGGDDGTLSMDDAVKAYAKVLTNDAAGDGQAEEVEEADADTTDDRPEGETEGEEEGDPESEGQAEGEEDDDEQQSEKGRFVSPNGKVTLPDGSVATVSDLIAGNLKGKDYTQKTMELAEQRRSFETQSSANKQMAEQLAQEREYMTELLQSIMPQRPDPALAQTDPYAYNVQKAQHEAFLEHANYLATQGQQAKQAQEQDTQAERTRRSNAEFEALTTKLPALKDDTRLKSFLNDVRTHGAEYGFTPAELAQALGFDHRQALVIRDAIAWRKLQASKTKVAPKLEGRPPIQKGGKRLSQDDQKSRSKTTAIGRLKQSGSQDDAVRAYLAMKSG